MRVASTEAPNIIFGARLSSSSSKTETAPSVISLQQ
jgi:hypothetical protein